jgi:outer membrane translocation and assembly module TamA
MRTFGAAPLVLATLSSLVVSALAQSTSTDSASLPATTKDSEAAYTRTIEGRTTAILALLELNDAAKSNSMHNTIMGQYRALRSWHDENDSKLRQLNKDAAGTDKDKAALAQEQATQTRASLKALHDQFIAKLSADLTAEQVEKVKDKMTYNKVQVTYNGYIQMLPDLTQEQKAKILEMLKEAREIAMDGGSAEEKTAVFEKYKGRINNYLSKQGYDLAKASREWNQRLKANSTREAGQPSN